jgi:Ca2+-binding RTX toxin-like protein
VLLRVPADVYRRGMRARARVLAAGGLPLVLALAAWGLAAPVALAQATCAFNAGTATVQVTLAAGAAATISRVGDAIAVDGTPCGAATVTNTDTVQVTGSGSEDDLTIDLSGGPFAPGKSAEGDGGEAEIEFAVDLSGGGVLTIAGSSGADALTLGSGGANLNADEAVGDADVALSGPAGWQLSGRQGADELKLSGGDGTGAAVTGQAALGGTGDDRILAGAGGATLDGGGGTDTVSYAGSAVPVRADLAKGTARREGLATDTLAGFEDLVGSAKADVLVGDAGANRLEGGRGRDRLVASKGDDVLKGGLGRDVLDLRQAKVPVTVNLGAGTASGLGKDTLIGIEDAIGSDRHDVLIGSAGRNELIGRAGADEIRGGAGRDRLVGGLGNDDLEGGEDADTLEGGKGRDQLNGGDGRDTCVPGPDPDAWTSCEVVKL